MGWDILKPLEKKQKQRDDDPLVFKYAGHIGSGGQGTCDLAKDVKTGKLLVVKTTKTYDKKQDRTPREVDVLNNILRPHPNILHMLDFAYTPKSLMTVYEFCSGGDLEKYIPDPQGPFPSERLMWHVFSGIAEGLAYLHYGYNRHAKSRQPHPGWRRVIHRDLKPDNIFFRQKKTQRGYGEVLLGDFGFATTQEQTSDYFMAQYASPELIERGINTHKNDVWAMGVIMHKLGTGKTPHKTRPSNVEPRKWYSKPGMIRPKNLPKDFTHALNNTMFKCLDFDMKWRYNSLDVFHRIQEKRYD